MRKLVIAMFIFVSCFTTKHFLMDMELKWESF